MKEKRGTYKNIQNRAISSLLTSVCFNPFKQVYMHGKAPITLGLSIF